MQVIFGHKYGYRPFPQYIEAQEFELFRKFLVENQKDVDTLDKWYKKDDNAIPSVYSLIPISTHFPNFVNKVSHVSAFSPQFTALVD